MTEPRERTTVYVAAAPNGPIPRWAVRVKYAGTAPTTLVSTTDYDEAMRMVRRYSAKYGWIIDHEDEGDE